ncbi:MAG: aspartate-semialdehyde dehydrogenase [Firmicutes bacterium]|nr:aspartate-semialdehyde dehydrogenase [Bacillota bacterium]
MNRKLRVGVLGATGMVGQRFITLLADHPWFEIAVVAASPRSAGKTYQEAVRDRWAMSKPIPDRITGLTVLNAADIEKIGQEVDFVCCAVDMAKEDTKKLEEDYAKADIPVISNNSAHRWTQDVPMIIPEINPEHVEIIEAQRKRLGCKHGFIAVKPNCSIQSYVPALHPLMKFKPQEVVACTYQAISGAGKTFRDWPEMVDNIIPFIGGEEEKSEKEPLKIWGRISGTAIVNAETPVITAQCIRVPVSDGHLAAIYVNFESKPAKEEIIELWRNFKGKPQLLSLPSAPQPFLKYFEEENRPQTKLDRDFENGMGVTIGRLREDHLFQYKFVALSHNTVRGAAGGGVLTAELLAAEGYLQAR